MPDINFERLVIIICCYTKSYEKVMILKQYSAAQIIAVILAGSFCKMSLSHCNGKREPQSDKTFETTDFADDTGYL